VTVGGTILLRARSGQPQIQKTTRNSRRLVKRGDGTPLRPPWEVPWSMQSITCASVSGRAPGEKGGQAYVVARNLPTKPQGLRWSGELRAFARQRGVSELGYTSPH
jgi:hypothetical protein